MPKLLVRRHSFLLKQMKSISNAYNIFVRPILNTSEDNFSLCSNIILFALHNLTVRIEIDFQ